MIALKNAFPQKIPLLKNPFAQNPLPYPPCQINDLAGNPGAPSLEGEGEENKGKLLSKSIWMPD